MAAKKFDLLGPAIADIGREAVRIAGGNPDGIFLYAEAGDDWVGTSLFKEEATSVRYIEIGDSPLDGLIMGAWCLEPVDKRWTAMNYTINGGRFHTSFTFDDLESSKESIVDRRRRVLRARYGDRPIAYPPLPSRAMKLTPPG
jgi:hypothetical protein